MVSSYNTIIQVIIRSEMKSPRVDLFIYTRTIVTVIQMLRPVLDIKSPGSRVYGVWIYKYSPRVGQLILYMI